MKNIVLLCAQGLSTGVLVNKMRTEADKRGIACTINAYSVSKIRELVDTASCFLIGPQVRYELPKVKEIAPNIPADVIDMVSYGRMDGAKVLDMALNLIK